MPWQQELRIGAPAPAAKLASLVTYPFAEPSAHTDGLRAVLALAQACASLPSISFAGCLAHACGALASFTHPWPLICSIWLSAWQSFVIMVLCYNRKVGRVCC